MARPPTLSVEGGRQLRSTLKRAGADMSELSAANREVAVMVAAATRYTRRTGRLAGSVRPSGTRAAATVRVGAGLPYAGVQEYGWDAHHIRPQAAVRTAAHATEPAWTAVYIAHIRRIVASVKGTST